jgi:arylsulfatase A-like enzyme
MGEHGHWHKMTHYEPDHGVPLVLSAPGYAGNGRRLEAFSEHVDIYPTLCELCGLPVPEHLEGTSFVPLLIDPDKPWKKAAFGQVERTHPDTGDRLMGYTMRTDRYRFTRWVNLSRDRDVMARELYDYETDPDETANRVDDPECAGALADLEALMDGGWRSAQPS